ncbi:MAG: right-handed parallel beta-helix repeat-containing protein, partial [Thermoplasmata archaeon]
GHTIWVASGRYYENVMVNKTLTIVGEDMNTTVIDGSGVGDVVNVTSDWVNITGFTVTGGGDIDGDAGIELHQVGNCTINNNNVSSNGYYGIFLSSSGFNNITSNLISGNRYGIQLEYSSNNNTIGSNIIGPNTNWGVHLVFSNFNNTVVGNTIDSNGVNGIRIHTGNEYNVVARNNISNSAEGIHLQLSNNNLVYHNNLFSNTAHAWDDGTNFWNLSYPGGGNYWDDYAGIDLNSTPSQDVPPPDGMGDTPSIIDGDSQDNYPMVHPYGSVRNLDTGEIFFTIQAAIDDADTQNGHRIRVAADTYYENVVVNKLLTLIGEDRDKTIIDGGGSGDVVQIPSDWVNITGFTLKNGGSGSSDSGIELGNVQYCNITDNIVRSNGNDGIRLKNSSNNAVAFNILSENGRINIFLDDSHDNEIEENTVIGREDIDGSELVGHWRMDEKYWDGVTGEVKDSSPFLNHGTANGDVDTTINGAYDRAGRFDGVDDYISADDVCSELTGSELSFGGWIKPMSIIDSKPISFHSSVYANLNMIIYSDNRIMYYDMTTSYVNSTTSFPINEWYHVMVTIDGSNNGKLFVNGVLDSKFTTTVRPDTSGRFSIGQDWDSAVPTDFFFGIIDEVTLFNRSLSENEIAELYYFSHSRRGIFLRDSTGNDLISNSVSMHRQDGIYLSNSSGNTLVNNIIGENERDNIRLEDSHDNVIEENTVYGKVEETGLAGYWRMDESYWEGAAGEVADSSGNGNHGTAEGDAVTTTSGKIGRAGYFDGVDDYVDCGNKSSVQVGGPGNSFSLGAWVRRASNGSHDPIIMQGTYPVGKDNYNLQIGYHQNDKFVFGFYNDDLYTTSTYLDVNEWHHWFATYDAKTNDQRLYRDGSFLQNRTTNWDYNATSGTLYIGRVNWDWGPPFNGSIDEVMLYRYALSDSEIAALYLASKNGIRIMNSTYNTVNNNTIYSNDRDGIHLMDSDHNNITGNILNGNGQDNIHLENSQDNTIRENNISGMIDMDRTGLVGFWKMDEFVWTGAAGEVKDSSGLGNDGAHNGYTNTTSGRFGRCGDFDGSSDYIDCGDDASLGPVSAITVEAWARFDSVSGAFPQIVARGDNTEGWNLYSWSTGSYEFSFILLESGSSWGQAWAIGTTIPQPDTWYHVVGTYDGSSVKIYI